MAYSLDAHMPFEGLRVAFNGEFGRLEMRDYERQPWEVATGEETEIYVTKSFGLRKRIPVATAEGGHGGGDDVMRDQISQAHVGARTHAAARLARRRHVVPDRHRGAQEHRKKRAVRVSELVRLT